MSSNFIFLLFPSFPVEIKNYVYDSLSMTPYRSALQMGWDSFYNSYGRLFIFTFPWFSSNIFHTNTHMILLQHAIYSLWLHILSSGAGEQTSQQRLRIAQPFLALISPPLRWMDQEGSAAIGYRNTCAAWPCDLVSMRTLAPSVEERT